MSNHRAARLVAAAMGLMLMPAAWAAPRGPAVLDLSDAPGDATTQQAPAVPPQSTGSPRAPASPTAPSTA